MSLCPIVAKDGISAEGDNIGYGSKSCTCSRVSPDDPCSCTKNVCVQNVFVFSSCVHFLCMMFDCYRGSDGMFELDFESNPIDIINSEHHEVDAVYRPVVDYRPEYRRSLRVGSCLYCTFMNCHNLMCCSVINSGKV